MIAIEPHKPQWEQEFREISAGIARALGNRILSIDHIGSTGVPGLAAKDVIDIQLTVSDLDIAIREPLESLGFVLGTPMQDHAPSGLDLGSDDLSKRFYKKQFRPVNLHVRKQGAFNQRYPLLFRDYLRSNTLACNAYGEIKKILARKFPDDMDAYYDIKAPVCDAIMAGAYLWAQTTDWQPG